MERFRRYYPESTPSDITADLEASAPIDKDAGYLLRGHRPEDEHDSAVYYLNRERTGMFLVDNATAITFFGLGLTKHKAATTLFGPGSPVSTSIQWAWAARAWAAGVVLSGSARKSLGYAAAIKLAPTWGAPPWRMVCYLDGVQVETTQAAQVGGRWYGLIETECGTSYITAAQSATRIFAKPDGRLHLYRSVADAKRWTGQRQTITADVLGAQLHDRAIDLHPTLQSFPAVEALTQALAQAQGVAETFTRAIAKVQQAEARGGIAAWAGEAPNSL